ncbi:MAG: DUF1957 domain-containing protein [Alphaproteobacteria bacterium]|nr:DUF1957 domain-containing protein [Alphaproteobacteria bacterium]MCB9791753.1 DUF1957 domain-containing protein [Alphaproteobacteria bacterium]
MSKLCLVLHGHVPYVLNHGRRPHGEHWLYEAAAETWLRLIDTLEGLDGPARGVSLTLSLSPILLEQLASPLFQERFPVYLAEQEQRAHADERGFTDWGDHHLAGLARGWADHYMDLADRFEALDRDLPGALARLWDAGRVELITSFATYAYPPLLLHDASCRAQVRVALETAERVLGRRPEGFWLPECALRPGGLWSPPIQRGAGRDAARRRAGTAEILAQEGVRYTLVDERVLRGARSEGLLGPEGLQPVGWDQAASEPERAWRSPLEPHLAYAEGEARLSVLAGHSGLVEQVASGSVGYPADSRYLEFHKRHGDGGLRYWSVSSARAGLSDKERHDPQAAQAALDSHAQAFCGMARSILRRHARETGRPGVLTAPLRAELLGHWWHEGPEFLKAVLERVAALEDLQACSVGEALREAPADKLVRLPEGSASESGDHTPWLGEGARWMWQVLYDAEDRFGQLCLNEPWRDDDATREALELAGRELLLLQASDWTRGASSGEAADYAMKRFAQHAARFDRCCEVVEDRHVGRPLDAAHEAALAEARASDVVFEGLRLSAWESAPVGRGHE